MELQLSLDDLAMLNGEQGEATQIAMRVIVRMAEIGGANELIDIQRAHIDACGYPGTGAVMLAELLASKGGSVRVQTTMNAVAEAPETKRLVNAFVQMGALPTLTCAPYQLPGAPQLGEQIAWGESNAVAFANSVLGARTNRYGDGMDICAALTGRVPRTGYHLDQNRKGTMHIRVPAMQVDSTLYPVLGYLIGGRAGSGVPVIEGLQASPSMDELKTFAAAIASSGAVALFHILGITPEAKTRGDVLSDVHGPVWEVTYEDIRNAYRELAPDQTGRIDAVVFGSPHLSLHELSAVAAYAGKRRRHRNVDVILTTSRHVYQEAEQQGIIAELERFGAVCLVDTCPCFLDAPTIPTEARTILTPSGKYAHYGPGLLQRKVIFASTEDCIDAAVTGEFSPRLPSWLNAV